MRRIHKVKPKEISLCLEGANRRIIAMYKSKSDALAKGGPGSGPQKGDGTGRSKDEQVGNPVERDPHPAATARSKEKERSEAAHDRHDAAADKAQAASRQAEKANTSASHKEAASAFQAAAKAAKAAGDHEAAKEHSDSAAAHSRMGAKAAALGKSRGREDLESAISNTDPAIYEKLTALAKSVDGADGQGYSPQAASIVKAVGRLLAPFSEELTLSDLQSIGKAAGLGAKAKSPDEEDSEDEDAAPGLKKSAAEDDEEEEDEFDEEATDSEDEEEDEEEDEDTTKSARRDVALTDENAENLAKSASDDSDEEDEEDEEDEDEADGDQPPAFIRAKMDRKKGEKVSKSASQQETSRFAALEKAHRALVEQNKAMSEEIKKSRKDLDDERDYRQMEAVKKSIREDYPALALEADKYAPMLKTAKEAEDQAGYQALTELLAKCNKQVAGAQAAGGIFTAMGKSSSSKAAEGGGDWGQRIEAAVDEQMKKSAKGTRRAVVYDEFIQTPEGREMHSKHRSERGF